VRLWLAWSKSVGTFLTDRTRALAPSTPSQMSLCQTSCPRCLWKPSPGGLSMQDPTPPKRSPRAAPCLPLHSSRKRAPGNDRLRARTLGQGALFLYRFGVLLDLVPRAILSIETSPPRLALCLSIPSVDAYGVFLCRRAASARASRSSLRRLSFLSASALRSQ